MLMEGDRAMNDAKSLDLAALQAICKAAGETVRQEAIASGTLLPIWDDARGVIEIDPVTGKEPNVVSPPFGLPRVVKASAVKQQTVGVKTVTAKEIKLIAAMLLASSDPARARNPLRNQFLHRVRARALAAALLAKVTPSTTAKRTALIGGKRAPAADD
jgi:hypothetical protein